MANTFPFLYQSLFYIFSGRRSRESSGGSDKENLGTPSSSSVTSPLGASNKATPPLTMGATNKTTPPIMTDESMRILKSIESNTEKNNMYHNFKGMAYGVVKCK